MTPDELFALYPEVEERIDGELESYFSGLTPEQQAELETADRVLTIRTDGDVVKVSVGFRLAEATPDLAHLDGHKLGLHVIGGEVVYVEDRL